jgi:general secretion pathway protein D
MLFWLSIPITLVYGARIAGEEDVTPASSEIREKKIESTEKAPLSKAKDPTLPASEEPSKPAQSAAKAQTSNAEKSKSGTRYITIDFNDVDIQVFIKFISEMTGKNFIIDKSVKGKVTIISPTKITINEAYKVFESVLEVNGFTTIPAGKVIKVVPAIDARSKDIETRLRREAIRTEDKIVTQLISLDYANPDDLKKLFGPFISKSSVMVSYPPTGMLIVTDVLSNIKRLLNIIKVLDVEGIGAEITVLPLEHATASVMAKSLSSVFQQTTAKNAKTAAVSSSTVKIVPDERTNVLIILASEDDTFKIRQLVKLLDQETPRGEGDVHVYYLQNANAEDLAAVLTAIPKDQKTETEKGKTPVISKDLQIVADQSTNSLIITAKKADYLILEDVIKKLDIPRRMVYIEALIMEVDMNDDMDLGVEWYVGDNVGTFNGRDVLGYTGSNPGGNILPSIDDTGSVSLPTGFSLGVLGDVITIGGVSFNSLGAAIRALKTDSDVRLVSTPQLMTMDNEEAEIVVADNIPYLTRQDTSAANVDYSSYEYRDVGVTLNITPQINRDRFVRLKVYQEISQVVEEESVIGLPTTLKRVAKTTITIKDGQTIVIGGLLDDFNSVSNYKVPLLGDIPLLGALFRSTSQERIQKNLYIFITPHIVENPAEAKEVSLEKKEYIDVLSEGSVKMYEGRSREEEDMRWSNLGYKRLQVKDYDKAMEYFKKALSINPDNPYAILNMGVIYQAKGEDEKAVEMYTRLISLDPEERAINSTDPGQQGKKLSDIAKDNLEILKGQSE